jgi:hypothetical protein
MNDDHNVAIVASSEDGIYYKFRTRKMIDLDEKYEISNTKEIIYDFLNDHEEIVYYLLSNKYIGKLGVFLLRFS